MVKSISQNRFICEICHRLYETAEEARACQEGHDLIYVAFERSDLKRLINFIHSGEVTLLTPSLMQTLEKYALLSSEPEPKRSNYVPSFDEDEEK